MKVFPEALGVSLLAHAITFILLAAGNILPNPKTLKKMEVRYYSFKTDSLTSKKKLLAHKTFLDPGLTIPGQRLILSNKNEIPLKEASASLREDELFLKSKGYFSKPSLQAPGLIQENTFNISRIEAEYSTTQSQSPAYLTYSNYLHERYRHSLYRRYSDIMESGVVSLKFALNADGSLAEYKIIDEKSNASEKLKYLTVEALKESAPFPRLPQELGSAYLSFRVSIHFTQVKEK